MARLIAITGGIGSGKSVVSKILRILGYKVYDCDIMAKSVTNSNTEACNAIRAYFGPQSFSEDDGVNWKYLSSCVFNSPKDINVLNSIIHPLVKQDIVQWHLVNENEDILFVESAILKESGIDVLFDEIWKVLAPESVRIDRVMQRNGISSDAVKSRINAQNDYNGNNVKNIINDNQNPVLPQVLALI